ncbi:ABC transporter substrate-binding protein [Dactylosporangium sp. CA-233914]|uniref:ABC transporter substrate-binding protein n=1 Tax=Dactylosporangium sp. CA-233914 TaxID=3239934 RepID=UPI003D90BCD9
MRFKRPLLTTLGLSVALVLSACSGGGNQPAGDGQKQAGGTVTIGDRQINWFNPILSAAACTGHNLRTVQSMLYRPVLAISPKLDVNWADSIASAVTPSDQGTKYSVTLKPFKWSDGTQITSADVAAFYYVLKYGAKSNSCLFGLGGLPDQTSEFKITDETHFEINYTPRSAGYNPTWVQLSALTWLTPLPIKQWVTACPGTGFSPTNPSETGAAALWQCLNEQGANYKWAGYDTVSGPYKIDAANWNSSSTYPFVKNAAYSGQAPSLDKIILVNQASTTDVFTGLKSGTLDIGVIPANLVPQVKSLRDFTAEPAAMWADSRIVLNLQAMNAGLREAFNDKQVRIALQRGVDTDTIVNNLSHGVWYPSYGPVPSNPQTYLSPELKSGSPYPFDIEKAKQVLAAAGYTLVDGVQTKNGTPLAFTLTYTSGDPMIESVVQLLQSDWAKIGVKVTLTAMPAAALGNAQFDPAQAKKLEASTVFPGGWVYQPNYYPTGETLWNCNGTSTSFFGFVCDEKLDRLISKTTENPSSGTSAQDALNQYQNYVADNAYNIFVPAGWGDLVVSNSVGGVRDRYASHMWYPEYWYRTS